MKRLMATLLGALGFVVPLAAQGSNCCLCPPPCCGRFEVGGELLWFRPSTCDLIYAILDPRSWADIAGDVVDDQQTNLDNALPQKCKKSVRPNYKLGFRVWAAFITQDCLDITGEYTRYHQRFCAHAHPFEEGGLWPTFLHPNQVPVPALYNPSTDSVIAGEVEARAHVRTPFDYDAGEVQLGARATFGCRCALWVRGFAAVHYYNLFHRFCVHYTGTENPGVSAGEPPAPSSSSSWDIFSKRSIRSWGVGPRVGAQAVYDVACGLGVAGRAGVALLAGGGRAKRFETVTVIENPPADPPVPVIQEVLCLTERERMHVVPRFDARLGINLTTCLCGCFLVSAEVGYELISYINPVRSEIFTGNQGTCREICSSFDLNGLYFSLMGQF